MRHKKGYALATILVLLGVALFATGSLVTISTLESKISRSQKEGTSAYYAAESGVEVALWNLNNNAADAAAFVSPTGLDKHYIGTNIPAAGQGFDAHVTSNLVQGIGYGSVEVTGYSNNGTFTANRKILTQIFKGQGVTPGGGNSAFAGGSLSISNGSAAINITGGGLYGASNIAITSATVNMSGQKFSTTGTYSTNNQSHINNSGGVSYLATPYTVPGIDFTYYKNNATRSYTAAAFTALSGGTITLPGPITYVEGDVILNSANKTYNITGLLVINGNLTTTANNLAINVTDPGTGVPSGIYVLKKIQNNKGTWNVNGLIYASGDIAFNNSQSNSINGGLVAGGSISINTGVILNLTYVAGRVTDAFGSGTPLAVQVQHWEEEY